MKDEKLLPGMENEAEMTLAMKLQCLIVDYENKIPRRRIVELMIASVCGSCYHYAMAQRLNQEQLEDMLREIEDLVVWHRENCSQNIKSFNENFPQMITKVYKLFELLGENDNKPN